MNNETQQNPAGRTLIYNGASKMGLIRVEARCCKHTGPLLQGWPGGRLEADHCRSAAFGMMKCGRMGSGEAGFPKTPHRSTHLPPLQGKAARCWHPGCYGGAATSPSVPFLRGQAQIPHGRQQ